MRLKIQAKLYAILHEKLTSRAIANTLACEAGTLLVHPKQVKIAWSFSIIFQLPVASNRISASVPAR